MQYQIFIDLTSFHTLIQLKIMMGKCLKQITKGNSFFESWIMP